ncbi:MAG: hypothetical protein HUJ53_05250 [Holdemanella sp.]|nr:hypothetical protein [Holdemanella sp.]
MKILYSSFHTIDLNNYFANRVEIPDYFHSFLYDFIEYANSNEKNKKYQIQNEEGDVVSLIKDVLHSDMDAITDTIAYKLIECEKMAQDKIYKMGKNIKKGSLIQAFVEIDEDEYQYVIAKVEHSNWIDGSTLQDNIGFSKDTMNIWKSAIFKLYKINDICLIDKILIYMDSSSKYWTVSFLELEEVRDDFSNTYKAYRAIDSELKSMIKPVSQRDYVRLSNEIQNTINTPQEINYNQYIEELIDTYEPSNKEIEKDVIKDTLLALPDRKKFDKDFKTVPTSIINKRTKKYAIAKGIELTIKSDASDFSKSIVSTMDHGKRVIQIICEDDETYEAFTI